MQPRMPHQCTTGPSMLSQGFDLVVTTFLPQTRSNYVPGFPWHWQCIMGTNSGTIVMVQTFYSFKFDLQVPLMIVSQQAKYIIGKRAGNLVVWMSLILGQPLALMMYYHDFVVAHYGSELIASFGTMHPNNTIS